MAPPAAPAVTVPVDGPTGATVTLLLLQVPPAIEFVKVCVTPEHIVVEPEMAAGRGLTVTTFVVKHPVVDSL